MFKIGHDAISCTETPGFLEIDNEDGESAILVDCPGLNDVNANKEYPNRTIVHSICQNAKTVKICILLDGNQFEEQRGAGVLKMLTTLSRMLTSSGRLCMPQMIYPFMSKLGNVDSPIKLNNKSTTIHDLLRKKLDVLRKIQLKGSDDLSQEEREAQDAHVGDEFPMHEELKFVKYILKVTVDKLKVVHPIDEELSKKYK